MIEHSDAVGILQEFKRRQEHVIHTYVPQQGQEDYHRSSATVRLLFGGNQSGKSRAAAQDCAWNAIGDNPYHEASKMPHGRDVTIWLISTEYVTIIAGVYRHLRDILPDWAIKHEGSRVPGHNLPTYITVKRKDGYVTTIVMKSAKGEAQARAKFQAEAVDYIYIDEEITGDIWEELEARTLATGGKFSISATLVESYDWIVQLERRAEQGDKELFITRLSTAENPYIDQVRMSYLKEKWSSETLEYRFYGKARRRTGLIYSNFHKDIHVIEPFKIPLDWPRWCAIDPGIRTCAALWVAVGPNNRAYAYRELYANNEPLWQVAEAIKLIEGYKRNEDLSFRFGHYVWEETDRSEQMVIRLIDPKGRARSEAGEESIINQLYERYGLLCTPANNAVRPGLEDCRFWLEALEDKLPGFQVFNTLQNFLEEIIVYRFRPVKQNRNMNDPIEEPIRKFNHLMDCFRYISREHPRFKDQLYRNGISTVDRIADRVKDKDETYHEVLGVW